jgi:radical SAM protein with 4Fe4S-binding SPASM domain
MDSDLFKIVEIEINSYCNLACSYCPNREFERKEKGDMSLEDYNSIIDQLIDLNFKGRISHEFYGEPTLHPNYDEIIEVTKKKLPHCKLELYSNATRLDKDRIEKLFDLGLDIIFVTIHEGQENLPIRNIAKELSTTYQERLIIREHGQIYKTNRGGSLPDIGGDKQPLLPCKIPEFLITITVKGNVLPCFEDFFQNHEMGNVFKTPLKEIWNHPDYIQLRRDLRHGLRHKYETCKDCNRIQTLGPDQSYFEIKS